MMALNVKTGEMFETDNENEAGLTEALLHAEQDTRLVEKDLRSERRLVATLRAELANQQAADARRPVAEAIFRYWVKRCSKNSKTTVFGEKRAKAVYARLQEYTPTQIARAIDGLAAYAYVNEQTGKVYNDLELVCRNEVNLERYYELAEWNGVPSLVGPAWKKAFGMVDDQASR